MGSWLTVEASKPRKWDDKRGFFHPRETRTFVHSPSSSSIHQNLWPMCIHKCPSSATSDPYRNPGTQGCSLNGQNNRPWQGRPLSGW